MVKDAQLNLGLIFLFFDWAFLAREYAFINTVPLDYPDFLCIYLPKSFGQFPVPAEEKYFQ